MKSRHEWFVYIVRCRNNAYYTGITKNLARRLDEHNNGKGGSYTRSFRPVQLAWHEEHRSRSSASKREAAIKNMPRAGKQILINS